MAFTVTDFKSNLFSNAAKGGARPSLFKVSIRDSSSSFTFTATENILVKAAAIPAATVAPLPVNYAGRAYKMTGFRTYDNWTTTIINDEDFGLRNVIEEWMNLVSNHKLNKRDGSFGIAEGDDVKYKKDLTVTQFGKQGNKLKSYKFFNAFPTALSPIALDWSAGEIEEFTCTWTYDYWLPV